MYCVTSLANMSQGTFLLSLLFHSSSDKTSKSHEIIPLLLDPSPCDLHSRLSNASFFQSLMVDCSLNTHK